jgi:hypothetical protein
MSSYVITLRHRLRYRCSKRMPSSLEGRTTTTCSLLVSTTTQRSFWWTLGEHRTVAHRITLMFETRPRTAGPPPLGQNGHGAEYSKEACIGRQIELRLPGVGSELRRDVGFNSKGVADTWSAAYQGAGSVI